MPGLGTWFAVAIAVATAGVYSPVAGHDFVDFDDLRSVVENPQLRAPLTWTWLIHDATKPILGNWIPLTALSLRIDYALFGLWAPGYALHSLGLHILGSLLLYAALQRMTGACGRSAFVAAVFALHPLHVESVAWISERKDVLSGALAMATLYLYARYTSGPPSLLRRLPVLLAFTAGLLAKPMLVTLPALLLLLDVWPLGRLRLRPMDFTSLGKRVLEKLPLLALVAGASWVTLRTQGDIGAMYPTEHLGLELRLLNALDSYWIYFRQSLWPSQLAAFYLHPLQLVDPWRAILAGIWVIGVSAGSLWCLKRRPYLAVGWFWYLGTLVPVIGIVQVGMQAHADRYTYIPQIGLCIALSWGMYDLFGATRRARRGLSLAAVLALAALALVARHQVGFWSNSLNLHERIVEVNPESYRSLNHLARAYLKVGRLDDAESLFVDSLRGAPTWAPPRLGLGDVALRRGDPEGAIELYQMGRDLDPSRLAAYNALSIALQQVGRVDEARVQLREAIARARPSAGSPGEIAFAHRELAKILRADGDSGAALRHLEVVRGLAPDDRETRVLLAAEYTSDGRWEAARKLLEDSAIEGFVSAELFVVRARLALHDGRPEQARVHYRVARTIDPDSLIVVLDLYELFKNHAELGDADVTLELAENLVARGEVRNPSLLEALARAREARESTPPPAASNQETSGSKPKAVPVPPVAGDVARALHDDTPFIVEGRGKGVLHRGARVWVHEARGAWLWVRLSLEGIPALGRVQRDHFEVAIASDRPPAASLEELESLGVELIRDQNGKIFHLKAIDSFIGDDDLAVLSGLNSLESVDLGRTLVGDEGMGHLAALASLRRLYLDHTRVGNAGLQRLRALESLEVLTLQGSRVDSMGFVSLASMRSLRTLNLEGLEVDSTGLEKLTPLPRLEVLVLAETAIDDVALTPLARIPSLRVLNLDGTGVSSEGLQRLVPLEHLKVLRARGTGLSEDAVRRFRRQRPETAVFNQP